MDLSVREANQLPDENTRLRATVADLTLDWRFAHTLSPLNLEIEQKFCRILKSGGRQVAGNKQW